MLAILVPTLLTLMSPGSRCERPAPGPIGFHSRGFQYVAEIFPPRSRQNRGEQPVAYLYHVEYPGTEWRVDARRVWTGPLANMRFPAAALVSMRGDLVTLDEYDQPGFDNAVVIHDLAGRLVRSFSLADLLPAAERNRFQQTDCGIHWTRGARYFFTRSPSSRLYIVLATGTALEFDLASGVVRHGPPRRFPELAGLLALDSADEEARVWPINLRFSSITDVLNGRS